MSKLRVAIFTGNYNHIQDGVSLTLNRLVAFLEDKGVPVLVFGPTSDKPDLEHEGDFVPVPSVPIPGRQEYRFSTKLSDKVRQRLHTFSPTLVHLATPDVLGFCALRWAQQKNIPVVASYHTHFSSYFKYYKLNMLEMASQKYVKWFYGQCKHVYVPSPSMAEELNERGITNGIRIWARGVDTEMFSPSKRDEQWREENGFNPDDIVVSFVSRLVWEKNLKAYINTVKKLKHKVKPMIVGNGPAMEEVQEMLPEACYTDFITGRELACAYASSDIFFFPSETETFGNVTLEAMASGLPCIVADATGSKSLVEEGFNGYLAPPHDIEAFVKKVSKVVDDKKLRTQMAKKAREKALTYSWEKVNGRLLDNYREAIEDEEPEIKL